MDATVTSAGFSVYQTNTGATNVDLHKVLVGWTENTVTWSSFYGGPSPIDAVAIKTLSNSPSAAFMTYDIKALAQGWVNLSVPNNGVLLKQDSAPLVNGAQTQTQIRSRDYGVVNQRPLLSTP